MKCTWVQRSVTPRESTVFSRFSRNLPDRSVDILNADQLKRAVESKYGCKAALVQTVPVQERSKITTHLDQMTFERDETV